MIGEIRDQETALEAVRASQTGHVVLSTLHANDTTDSLQRLYDLGVYPNSIANELSAIITQRLAKRICANCKKETEPDQEILKELYPDGNFPDIKYFKGEGCNMCQDKGTKGRIAVIEFLKINKRLKEAIADSASSVGFRNLALQEGLISMRESALSFVEEGVIELKEVRKLLPTDKMADERKLQ
jgi:type IV pilus assembly protein PilB